MAQKEEVRLYPVVSGIGLPMIMLVEKVVTRPTTNKLGFSEEKGDVDEGLKITLGYCRTWLQAGR